MKTSWTAQEICAATHSSLCSRRNWTATGLAIDSRFVKPGDLFVALKGERVDGHQFLDQAFEKGAVAALVEYAPPTDHNLVVVHNTQEALIDLGQAARNKLHGTIIGVTGSAGKTSLKEMLGLVLSSQGTTYASPKSYNTKLTVPLSLVEATPDLEYGVFEVGTSQPGEIAPLSRMVRPHIGVITSIGAAHKENFASIDHIAQEKSTLFAGMSAGSPALLPWDCAQKSILTQAAKDKGLDPFFFGFEPEADITITQQAPLPEGMSYTCKIFDKTIQFTLQMTERHWALNALTCMGIVYLCKGDLEQAAQALSQYRPPAGRGRLNKLSEGRLLVDESYNANPLSMKLAIESFIKRPQKTKKILVLGDMFELGDISKGEHANLVHQIKAGDISLLLTCGEAMTYLHEEAKKLTHIQSIHCPNTSALVDIILEHFQPEDMLMLKASNGMGFQQVRDQICQHFRDQEN